jgi:hypothetical protein
VFLDCCWVSQLQLSITNIPDRNLNIVLELNITVGCNFISDLPRMLQLMLRIMKRSLDPSCLSAELFGHLCLICLFTYLFLFICLYNDAVIEQNT